ncbi:MAG TPA: DUF4294 domain-containing protein [Bacteroidia bacterium]|nr:DUF4294 domain-containing protein [Bacteroidia bacterium]
MKNALLSIIAVFGFSGLFSQDLAVGDISQYPKDMVVMTSDQSGDTTVHVMYYTCVIVAEKTFTDPKEKAKWDRLKYDVKVAYPYSVLAKMKLAEMDSQLARISGEKERKEYNEKCEKELTRQFDSDMRNLTHTQGKILFKLIDRETGSTTYELIKDRRGSFSAFMWQGVAVVFGNNLKDDYDPDGEDANIEQIVQLIELGVI